MNSGPLIKAIVHPVRVVIVNSLISSVHQRVKPQSQNFRIRDLHSKSITTSRMQRGIGTSPRCIWLFGSRCTNYLSHYLSSRDQRIDYEMYIPPKHNLQYITAILVCID